MKTINFPIKPWGGVCHNYTLTRCSYEKGDESATDFAYALALCRKGFTQAEVMQRIITERQDWKNHSSAYKQKRYLQRTIERACKIIAQS